VSPKPRARSRPPYGWGGSHLRGDEPKGRKADDHQRGDDNDDESHLQALKRCAKLLRLFFLD